MANTYTQLHIQLVFAVKYRAALIQKEWKPRLHQYITGIFQKNEHKMSVLNAVRNKLFLRVAAVLREDRKYEDNYVRKAA